jgi:SSS family solute:Na+ symporter
MKRISFAAVGIVLTVAPNCNADEGAVAGVDVARPQGLAVIDWVIVVLYAIGTITLGWYYSRRQNSTKEYFVGSGNMNPWLIGVSLFATLLSTISYLSMPGESLGKGPMYMLSMLALPAVFAVVGFVLLPVYMKQRVTSAYELLEERLGPNIRLLGAWLFISLRLVWMSLLIYLTAKAMTIMLGVGEDMIPVIALVTGFVAVIYTSLGGLRAVVITDFVQTVLLFGGALLVLATISWNLGGLGWIPTEWNPSWDTQPIFSTDFSVRVTLVGSLLNYFVWYVCTAGGDQTSVQRFMATKDAAAARRALAADRVRRRDDHTGVRGVCSVGLL